MTTAKPATSVRRMTRVCVEQLKEWRATKTDDPEWCVLYATKACVDGVRRNLRKLGYKGRVHRAPSSGEST